MLGELVNPLHRLVDSLRRDTARTLLMASALGLASALWMRTVMTLVLSAIAAGIAFWFKSCALAGTLIAPAKVAATEVVRMS